MERALQPEILDSLPPDDGEAQRSRRDLRRINFLMGNHRWIRRQVATSGASLVVELGAGGGEVLRSHNEAGFSVAGIDLIPRPEQLSSSVCWWEGDVFEHIAEATQSERAMIVANLFLHHLDSGELARLGSLASNAAAWCVCEPWRSRFSLAQAYSLWPMVNNVTRHDMIVSIKAGFRSGELPHALGLDSPGWQVRERLSWRGGYRMFAVRVP